jgi:osmotically inducible protein OsmC
MKRKGSAVWKGGLKEGAGTVSSESGVLKDVGYSFAKRFGEDKGTNPEELIGAAHAACFSMALSGALEAAGMTPESIDTSAEVTVGRVEGGFAISTSHLTVRVRSPGADPAAFQKAAEEVRMNCPVSKVLKAEITMDAKLV